MFPQKTMIRSFFAAVIAAMTLWQLDATGTGKLTMFQVQLNDPAHPIEYVVFVLLGVLGGLLGAFFCWGNIEFNRGAGIRQTPTRDVFFIILFTAISSYPMLWTANLSSPTIRILFQDCANVEGSDLTKMRTLCTGAEPSIDGVLCVQLLCACFIRLIQMTFTFGCAVPCGLFVPSLYTGACLGRVVGIGMRHLAVATGGAIIAPAMVNPGVYAMVGAAAVLGGVCRVTISLVVICLELTGGSQIIPAFMLALLISKWVGDLFTGGIYDMCIELRGYPFLHEEDDVTFNTRACDIMDTDLVCIPVNPGTIKELRAELRRHEYSVFPVVSSPEDHQFHGVLHKEEILDFLDKYVQENQTINEDQVQVSFAQNEKASNALPLADHLDHLLLNIVPDTPLAQLHNIFRGLGDKVVIVLRFGKLIGMITKKSFVHSFHHGHIGHIGEDPVLHHGPAQHEQASQGNALEEALLEGISGIK
jgi:chloride channel 3/4/5